MPDKMPKYHQSHTDLCKGYLEDLNKTFKKYHGKIADTYLCPLAVSIKEIQQQRETVLSVIERGKQ